MLINVLRFEKNMTNRAKREDIYKMRINHKQFKRRYRTNDIAVINDVTKDLAPKHILPCNHLIPICAYLLRYTAKVTQFADKFIMFALIKYL